MLGSKALWCRADSSSTACLLYVTGAWSVINLHVSALTPFLLLQSASCSMCCLAGTPQEGLHVLTSTACTDSFIFWTYRAVFHYVLAALQLQHAVCYPLSVRLSWFLPA